MQLYAGVYLLQNYSACFGCLTHPSSGVHQTLTAASGLKATLREGCCSDTMACSRSCSYSLMYSWWLVRQTPETCRVILQ